jgi:ribosomal protein L16 Arg81 hydroxylase
MLSEVVEEKFRHRADGPPLSPPWRFADVLAPLSVAQFCAAYWAREPLLIQVGNRARYEKLISLEDIERLLFIEGLLPSDSITTPYRTDGTPEPPPASAQEAYDRLSAGKPLRLRRLEKILPPDAPAVALLRDMEAALGHPKASLSCYVSLSADYGLGPHHDETEIFTLQICGSKRWRLYHKNIVDEPGLWTLDGLDAPSEEFVLEPGDFLYLPGGLVHDVTVDTGPSFSLTLVFEPFRWREMLELLVARLAEDQEFLAPLPAAVSLSGQGGSLLASGFRRRMDVIQEELARLSPEDLLDALKRKHICKSPPGPRPRLAEIVRLDDLQLSSVIEHAPGEAAHLATGADRVTLTLCGGYSLSAGLAVAPAFRDILARRSPFRVADLHACLGPAAKIALARRLVAYGLLRVVDFGESA